MKDDWAIEEIARMGSIIKDARSERDKLKQENIEQAALIWSYKEGREQARAQRNALRGLLQESLRCLKAAKHAWAPSTTNSDADVLIARIDAALQEAE